MRPRITIVIGLIVLGAVAGVLNALPKDSWYAQHYFLMQDYERKAYKGLSITAAWNSRRCTGNSVRRPRKRSSTGRIAYIMPTFKNENSAQPWNTDRAASTSSTAGRRAWSRRLTTTGPARSRCPAASQRQPGPHREDIQGRTLEIWTYPSERQVVVYGFSFSPPNKWVQAQISASGGRYIQGLEKRSRIETWGPSDEDAYKARLAELKKIK
jgi:hypothetical protein